MAESSTSFQPGVSGNPRGRPRGARNRASARRETVARELGITPLDFMLSLLRDENASPEDRKWAAEKAAPYIHPRVSPMEVNDGSDVMSHEDWLALLDDDVEQ